MLKYSGPKLELREGFTHHFLDDSQTQPVALYLPQAYEPRYPYPLLVFLHGYGERESQWMDAVPHLSLRNYICIGLRGPFSVQRQDGTTGYSWKNDQTKDISIEDYILNAIFETMRSCHVHSERIFLAGICEGATVAYQVGLANASKLGGVIALDGSLPPAPLATSGFDTLRDLSVFIGHGLNHEATPIDKAYQAFRFFYACGSKVRIRTYDANDSLCPAMLRDVDRWLISRCEDV